MNQNNKQAILLFSCEDQKGLVFEISKQLYLLGCNITDLNEHVDLTVSKFFVRVAFQYKFNNTFEKDILTGFKILGNRFSANWNIHFQDKKQKIALFVSKYDHCLQEILWRNSLNEFNIEIVAIISNHVDLKTLSELHKIPFYHFAKTKENKFEIEKKEIEILLNLKVDTVVLARYMQILSSDFVSNFPNRIINIHHSFLPAFIGGNPYKQAFNRGVKIIGATSHYVTDDLDEDPIIEQDIIRITHDDELKDLIRKGRDLERLVLASALSHHTQYRILVDGKKTIVFR